MRKRQFVPLAIVAVMLALWVGSPRVRADAPATTQAATTQMGVKFVGMGPPVATTIVFICDASDAVTPSFDPLRKELRKAVEGLKSPQKCNVVFAHENAKPPLETSALEATDENKKREYEYIDSYKPGGAADIQSALKTAFAMKPNLIFLVCDPKGLSDPEGTFKLCQTYVADHKCKINTVAFREHDEQGENALKKISEDSGGHFKYVSDEEMKK